MRKVCTGDCGVRGRKQREADVVDRLPIGGHRQEGHCKQWEKQEPRRRSAKAAWGKCKLLWAVGCKGHNWGLVNLTSWRTLPHKGV